MPLLASTSSIASWRGGASAEGDLYLVWNQMIGRIVRKTGVDRGFAARDFPGNNGRLCAATGQVAGSYERCAGKLRAVLGHDSWRFWLPRGGWSNCSENE